MAKTTSSQGGDTVQDTSGEWNVSYMRAVELAFARGYSLGFVDGVKAAGGKVRRRKDDDGDGQGAVVIPLFRAYPDSRADH